MIDREKVIKGLEICSDCGFCESIKKFDLRCPYRNNDGKGCDRSQLLTDALAMLKEQNEMVRCKDCKYWQDNNGGYPHPECRWGHDETPEEDDFCSFGERR